MDSLFARVHRHLLCHQGDRLDPVETQASSFCLPDAPEFGHRLPVSPVPTRKSNSIPEGLGGGQGLARFGIRSQMPLGDGYIPPTVIKETSRKRERRASEAGLGLRGPRGSALEHLPRGQALRGDRDLQENRQGPETGRKAVGGSAARPGAPRHAGRPPSTPAPPSPRAPRQL